MVLWIILSAAETIRPVDRAGYGTPPRLSAPVIRGMSISPEIILTILIAIKVCGTPNASNDVGSLWLVA
jgi:hypothetical protein